MLNRCIFIQGNVRSIELVQPYIMNKGFVKGVQLKRKKIIESAQFPGQSPSRYRKGEQNLLTLLKRSIEIRTLLSYIFDLWRYNSFTISRPIIETTADEKNPFSMMPPLSITCPDCREREKRLRANFASLGSQAVQVILF